LDLAAQDGVEETRDGVDPAAKKKKKQKQEMDRRERSTHRE
jgi:hypothetical protein